MAGVVAVLLDQALTLSIFAVIYAHVSYVDGWDFAGMLVLFGISRTALGVADLFGEGLWWVGEYAKDGQLFIYRLRPISVLFQLCTERLHFERLAGSLLGLALVAYGVLSSNAPLSLADVSLAIAYTSLGVVFYFAVMVFGAAIAVASNGGTDAITGLWSLMEFGKYPTSVFGRVGTLILSTVLPISIVGFVPALSLLPRTHANAVGTWIMLVTPLAVLIFSLSALYAWRIAITNYEGTGT